MVFFAGGGTEKRSYKNGVLQERAIIKDSVVKRKKDWKMSARLLRTGDVISQCQPRSRSRFLRFSEHLVVNL